MSRWICPRCRVNNMPQSLTCFQCGAPQPLPAAPVYTPAVLARPRRRSLLVPVLISLALLAAVGGGIWIGSQRAATPAANVLPGTSLSAPAAPSSGPAPQYAGEARIELHGSRRVESIRQEDGQTKTPEPGKKWILIQVTVTATGSKSVRAAPGNFQCVGSDRIYYGVPMSPLIRAADPSVKLVGDELAPGGRVTGDLVFELPEAVEIRSIEYRPISLPGFTD